MRILDKNRRNYRRTFADKGSCIFCGKKEVLECRSMSSRHWRVLVNRFPYMDGNVMIVPIRHVERTSDLTGEEWQDFGRVLGETQRVLGKIFKAGSFNVALNTGPQSGASIPHLHWQVVPRAFKNITALNAFADLHIVAVTPEETKRLIDKEKRAHPRARRTE